MMKYVVNLLYGKKTLVEETEVLRLSNRHEEEYLRSNSYLAVVKHLVGIQR
jgi:hypothetical protein